MANPTNMDGRPVQGGSALPVTVMNGGVIVTQGGAAIPVTVMNASTPAELISTDANNAIIQGSDEKLFVDMSSGSDFQFLSGTANPPTAAPSDASKPAQYYNTSTKFCWNWNIGAAAWVAIPKVYIALLTQTGANAPVATVLEDTLNQGTGAGAGAGAGSWTRGASGRYQFERNDAFPEGKTMVFIYSAAENGGTGWETDYGSSARWNSADTVRVSTTRLHLDDATSSYFDAAQSVDDALYGTPVQILVYP